MQQLNLRALALSGPELYSLITNHSLIRSKEEITAEDLEALTYPTTGHKLLGKDSRNLQVGPTILQQPDSSRSSI